MTVSALLFFCPKIEVTCDAKPLNRSSGVTRISLKHLSNQIKKLIAI